MANVIYQGSTPTIRFYPQNGMNVGDLGDPTIIISQELVLIEPEEYIVDDTANYVSVKLTETETLQLVDGVPTDVQIIFKNDETQEVYRFPVHQLNVAPTLVEGGSEDIEDETGETGETGGE